MSRYTSDSRDRVLDAVDMLALVSSRVELRRAGVNSYFGLCPFHQERTGSFHVRPDEKHYHCFGCQASGDPFTFVMETEGLEFKGALEALADRFGVKLETEAEDPAAAARRERRERLYGLLGRAAAYYARYLWEAREAGPAREYLLVRGLSEETLRKFRVGYAPSAWDRMLLASRHAGYSDEELLAVGLAQRSRVRAGQSTVGELAVVESSELRERGELKVGQPSPEIVGKDLDGRTFRLSDYRGNVVVIDFWGDW